MSEYFKWGQTFGLWVKSETSLCRGEHRRVMKLEVQPLESAFAVDSQDNKGKVLEYKVCKLVQVNIQDGS